MKFFQKLDGSVLVSAREYDIASDTVIAEGQVVKLSSGCVTLAAAGETGAILGMAAEGHSGTADVLDPRANGTKILVADDPDAVWQCEAPRITQASSAASATSLIAASDDLAVFADDDFNGGYVQLVSRAADSTNTDPIGKVRRITDFTAASRTFALESGGTPAEGDVYAVYPPVGFAKGNLDSARSKLVLTATANLPLKVAGRDASLKRINLIAKKHVFAVDA